MQENIASSNSNSKQLQPLASRLAIHYAQTNKPFRSPGRIAVCICPQAALELPRPVQLFHPVESRAPRPASGDNGNNQYRATYLYRREVGRLSGLHRHAAARDPAPYGVVFQGGPESTSSTTVALPRQS